MPGRTAPEAVSAFLGPIQQAASVLGPCKITGTPRYSTPRIGDEHEWSLCSGAGVDIRRAEGAPRGRLRFFAAMSWRLIEDDRPDYGPYRVTSTGYDYSLTADDDELWALHWHPNGKSHIAYPHQHLGARVLAPGGHITNKDHLRTGRMTFEHAVRWVLDSGGAPACDDWEDRLTLAETPHILFRSWHDRHAEKDPSPAD